MDHPSDLSAAKQTSPKGDRCVLVGETAGHEVGHGDVDHGFRACGKGFVITGESAVEHEPAVGPLHCPAFRDRCESPAPGGALDDFEVDAEGGGVLEEVFAVAGVDPDLADRGMGGRCLVEEGLACGGVLDAGRGDQDGQQQAEGVGDDAPLPADDLMGES